MLATIFVTEEDLRNLALKQKEIKVQTVETRTGNHQTDNFKWIYYNFSFYYFSYEYESWSDSRQYCKQRGADLVIINSPKEQEFLQKAVANEKFWIGLKIEEGAWKWVDGSTLTTGYWRQDYPYYNYYNYYSYYAVMTASGWIDQWDYKYRWICKRRFCF
ncbi:C-type lectin domain family 10 member A [Myxocyprinus asiaticus]|uniref:C-type lectin domain family 10 member A n=1 Tax=Myxocyprinus asiaticus TaxID=70543 RepID=UPI002223DC16|nr:C-type lectin domain family 10 member A [Myxocyprinus asiaticus]